MSQQLAAILGAPLAEFLGDMVKRAAKAGNRRFPLVSADDFEQAMWERILAAPDKYRQLWTDEREGAIWAELKRAATRLGSEDDRYRRTQKALTEGYKPDDEQFYSTSVLSQLMPALIEAEFDPAQAVEKAAQQTDAAGIHIHNDDPEASGNYMVILIDVAGAYRELSKGDQKLLRLYYGCNQDDTSEGRWQRTQLANSMGITLSALQGRVYRAVGKLQLLLGGKDPWQREQKAA